MSRLLELIGLHVLTNREAIMEELDELPDERFAKGLSEAAAMIEARPEGWLFEACKVERLLKIKEDA